MQQLRKDNIIDDYHGTKVADPYRWMEDPLLPETVEWVNAQNKVTFEYLEKIPVREKIRERIKELWNYTKYSVPKKKGKYLFYTKNEGLQNQSVLYKQEGFDGIPSVLLDPNKLSEDGTVSMGFQCYTEDGSLLAYSISRSGSDWQEIKIRDVETCEDYPETLKWARFSGAAWMPDKSGFFYSRNPQPGTVPPGDEFFYNRVYWHKLGTSQEEDLLIYERPDEKEWGFSPAVTDDNKYLLLYISHGCTEKNRLYYRELDSKGPFIKLIDTPDAKYHPLDNIGNMFYFHSNLNAPRGCIIAIDINHPERKNWKVIIPESKDTIESVTMINNQFVICYLQDASNKLKIFNNDGSFDRDIELPDIGTVMIDFSGIPGRRDDTEMFFPFQSFLRPTCIYHYDFKTGQSKEFLTSKVNFDTSKYTTRQVFFTSKDGTNIPMFLVHKKDLVMDGNNPVLMGGYGGFNISLTPGFNVTRLVWMEYGGISAIVNLRGGGEYGEEWHRAGMLEKKQNVFDDFISGAEYLIKNKYTNSKKLGISGGSNGGLLVSACMLQRPDLFGAVICSVPLTDMLRYHKFTVGHKWIVEYGNPEENQEDFKYIYAYSPLHNIKEGVEYPPILIVTADTDDRVVPSHAKKFMATLQEKSDGKVKAFIRIETKAGHGQGKPTSKVINEQSDIFAFLFEVFQIIS